MDRSIFSHGHGWSDVVCTPLPVRGECALEPRAKALVIVLEDGDPAPCHQLLEALHPRHVARHTVARHTWHVDRNIAPLVAQCTRHGHNPALAIDSLKKINVVFL